MKDVYILGIESSCDETSVSIVKNGNEEIVTKTLSQIDIHKKFGGVVPEIASRSHAECITIVIDEAITESKLSWDQRHVLQRLPERRRRPCGRSRCDSLRGRRRRRPARP